MTDLTKITTPFGLLDDAYGPGTQDALKAHGGPYEFWRGKDNTWYTPFGAGPLWFSADIYRVKPTPPKPREWWGFCKSLHDTREEAEKSLADLRAAHGDLFDGIKVFHVREVLE